LHIDPLSEDVLSIKKKVISKSEIPFKTSDLFLIWNGKSIAQPGVVSTLREGSTVLVSYRNQGGCFLVSFSILMMIGVALVTSFCTCGLSLCVIPFLVPLLFILPLFCL
jgi:hypothetical protein